MSKATDYQSRMSTAALLLLTQQVQASDYSPQRSSYLGLNIATNMSQNVTYKISLTILLMKRKLFELPY